MTYRELIALYKSGKLNEEEQKQVALDIERHEAISEYLFEEEQIPEFGDLGSEKQRNIETGSLDFATHEVTEKENEMEDAFLKMIRSSIRKAFVKMGICVGAVLLLIMLFIIFCMPGIVDQFYYQPDEVVAQGKYSTTNQMSLDFSVYSELFLPGKYRNHVVVDSNGYGEYDINVIQNTSITGAFYNVAGKVERGELILYDVNLLSRPTGNAFVRTDSFETNFVGMGPAGTQQEAYKKLDTLDENEYYMAYVTLSEVMTYAEFKEWFDALDLSVGGMWCAVPEMKENKDCYSANEIIGFTYGYGGTCINFDKEKYPYLSLLDAEAETWPEESPEIMQTHFVSMLRYMAEQEDFCEMIGADEYIIDWERMAENIEKYGLHTYGFAIMAKPDSLISLSEMEQVCYIYTTPIL